MKIYKSIIEPVDTSVLWFNPEYSNNLMWYSPKGWLPINRNEEQDEDIEELIKNTTALKNTQDLYTTYYTLNSKSNPNGIRIYKPDGKGGKEDFIRYYRKSTGQNRLEIKPFMTFETDSTYDYLNTLHIGDSFSLGNTLDKIGLDIERGSKVYLRSGRFDPTHFSYNFKNNWHFELFANSEDGIRLESSVYDGSRLYNPTFKLGGINSEEQILILGCKSKSNRIKITEDSVNIGCQESEVLRFDTNEESTDLGLYNGDEQNSIRLKKYTDGTYEAYFTSNGTHLIHYTEINSEQHCLFKIPQKDGFKDTGAIPKWYVNSRVFGGVTITEDEFNSLINGTQESISYTGAIMSHDVINYPAPNMPLSMTITVKDSNNKKTKYTLYRETVTDTTTTYYSRVFNEGTQNTKSIIECTVTNGADQKNYIVVIKLLSVENNNGENVKNIIFSDFYLRNFDISIAQNKEILYNLFEIVEDNTRDNLDTLFGAIWVKLEDSNSINNLVPLYLNSKVDYSGDYDYSYTLSSPIGRYYDSDNNYKYGFYTVSHNVNSNYNGVDFHEITVS